MITAYNEKKNIVDKVEQVLMLDHSMDRLEIIVASNGSTDRTDKIVKGFSDHGVNTDPC